MDWHNNEERGNKNVYKKTFGSLGRQCETAGEKSRACRRAGRQDKRDCKDQVQAAGQQIRLDFQSFVPFEKKLPA